VILQGKTYSGRLPYHQACASIIITTPLTFLLHTSHLLQPVYSSSLPLSAHKSPSSDIYTPPPFSYSIPSTKTTWPVSYPASLANIVFVQRDWSDLEDTIKYLRQNPEIAKGIAQRQRDMMVSEGYLSEAAEVCYWRGLIKGWSSMARVDEGEWEQGMRWETFSLVEKVNFDK